MATWGEDAGHTVVDRFSGDLAVRWIDPREQHLPLVDRKLSLVVDEYEPLCSTSGGLLPFTPRVNGAKPGVFRSPVSANREHQGRTYRGKRSRSGEPLAERSVVDGEHDPSDGICVCPFAGLSAATA